jgi:gluconolactonase
VWLFDRLGEPTGRVQSCADLAITNVAFGGSDGRRLFITESDSGSILMADVPVAGHQLYSHQ